MATRIVAPGGFAVVVIAAAACLPFGPRRLSLVAPCAVRAATAQTRLEIFGPPFNGDFHVGGLFDHDVPILGEGPDNQLAACDQLVTGLKGHGGYDWPMPIGTPLLAVADGRIVRAEQEPVTCGGKPGIGARVVEIEIRPNASDVILASYGHLDRIAVAVSDTVRMGDVIGTSGNTGCSTAPHLHFQAARILPGRQVLIDPYGWHSPRPDPWAVDTRGTISPWLWRAGAAPPLTR